MGEVISELGTLKGAMSYVFWSKWSYVLSCSRSTVRTASESY